MTEHSPDDTLENLDVLVAAPGTYSHTDDDAAAPAEADLAAGNLFDPAQATEFHERWRAVQAAFVDDPQGVAEHARALTAEVVATLSDAIEARRRDIEAELAQGADTERLRVAVRSYRTMLDRILAC